MLFTFSEMISSFNDKVNTISRYKLINKNIGKYPILFSHYISYPKDNIIKFINDLIAKVNLKIIGYGGLICDYDYNIKPIMEEWADIIQYDSTGLVELIQDVNLGCRYPKYILFIKWENGLYTPFNVYNININELPIFDFSDNTGIGYDGVKIPLELKLNIYYNNERIQSNDVILDKTLFTQFISSTEGKYYLDPSRKYIDLHLNQLTDLDKLNKCFTVTG